MNITVPGASGDQHIKSLVAQGVQTGLRGFHDNILPVAIRQAIDDPQVVRR